MSINRRRFLSLATAIAGGRAFVFAQSSAATQSRSQMTWDDVRELFDLRRNRIHMSGLLFASHPRPVRDEIARHREELQHDPASYISHERWRLEGEVLKSASSYLGTQTTEIALTHSTSMGLALLYSGMRLSSSDEILTTSHDHYAVESALLVCRERTGCTIKRIDMYRDPATTTAEEIVDAVRRAITSATGSSRSRGSTRVPA